MKIMIDPGHGGHDPGAVGARGLKEKDVTLRLAKLIAKKCGGVLTREGDEYISPVARATIANNAGADLFISVHCNAATDRAAHGVETLIYSAGGTKERIAEKVQSALVKATGLRDRGIKYRPGLAVLRRTNMPALLIETAFISNAAEEEMLADADFLEKVATAVAGAIVGEKTGYHAIVETMLGDGVITTPDYWQAVIEGKCAAEPVYLKSVIERYHAKIK